MQVSLATSGWLEASPCACDNWDQLRCLPRSKSRRGYISGDAPRGDQGWSIMLLREAQSPQHPCEHHDANKSPKAQRLLQNMALVLFSSPRAAQALRAPAASPHQRNPQSHAAWRPPWLGSEQSRPHQKLPMEPAVAPGAPSHRALLLPSKQAQRERRFYSHLANCYL